MNWAGQGAHTTLSGEYEMRTMKTLSLAIAIAFAAPSLALAQQGNPASNAAASGGGGTHQNSVKTGSAANSRKVLRNQNGYRGGRLYSRARPMRCHFVRRPGRRPVKVCR